MKVTNRTWIISDTHFGHRNIVKFQQRPPTHETIILSNWIQRVRDDDVLLHLGDVFLGPQGSQTRWAMILSRMPGRKYVVLGNHDKHPKLLERAGFEIISEFWQDEVLFTHRPVSLEDERPLAAMPWHTNVHGHTHANVWSPEHDGAAVPDRRYINVCVEHTHFAPVQYGNLR